jgi:hypothetical protein
MTTSLVGRPVFWLGLATIAGVGAYAVRSFGTRSQSAVRGNVALDPKTFVPYANPIVSKMI